MLKPTRKFHQEILFNSPSKSIEKKYHFFNFFIIKSVEKEKDTVLMIAEMKDKKRNGLVAGIKGKYSFLEVL